MKTLIYVLLFTASTLFAQSSDKERQVRLKVVEDILKFAPKEAYRNLKFENYIKRPYGDQSKKFVYSIVHTYLIQKKDTFELNRAYFEFNNDLQIIKLRQDIHLSLNNDEWRTLEWYLKRNVILRGSANNPNVNQEIYSYLDQHFKLAKDKNSYLKGVVKTVKLCYSSGDFNPEFFGAKLAKNWVNSIKGATLDSNSFIGDFETFFKFSDQAQPVLDSIQSLITNNKIEEAEALKAYLWKNNRPSVNYYTIKVVYHFNGADLSVILWFDPVFNLINVTSATDSEKQNK